MMEKLRSLKARLRSDTSGVAMIEFAYSLPVLMALGGYGMETANLASVNHQISQAALALADNMSRVGATSSLSTQQIRESDVNDGLTGVRRQATAIEITQRGRIILSSLQRNADGGQWIAWQRCAGLKVVSSSYGNQGTGATGTSFLGMGAAASRIQAPPGSAVMFVEVVYDYPGLFGTMFLPARTIRYEASFVVRDERDLTGGGSGNGMFNPTPAAPVSSCTNYSV